MASVCVEIAVRDDPHLGTTLASLTRQTRRPDRVLIAASTDSTKEFLRSALESGTGL